MMITYNPETKLWEYSYTLPPTIEGRELSNITLHLGCVDAVHSHSSNISYKPDITRDGAFKWDNLQINNQETTSFTLWSYHEPIDGVMEIKAGRDSYNLNTSIPSCLIPEMGSALLFGVGILLLLFKRNRPK